MVAPFTKKSWFAPRYFSYKKKK